MKQRILGVFHNIDDAKSALGQIKKESMNQAELTVIIGDRFHIRTRESQTLFETAAEDFADQNLGSRDSESRIDHFWPGLKEEQLLGIGVVKVGHNSPDPNDVQSAWRQKLTETALQIIGAEIAAKKIITFIEFDPRFLPKLRFIMETNGAELKEFE